MLRLSRMQSNSHKLQIKGAVCNVHISELLSLWERVAAVQNQYQAVFHLLSRSKVLQFSEC